MSRKILWTIGIIVLTSYLFFWNYCVRPFDFSDFIEAIGFISTFFTSLIFALALGLIFALIPFKQKKYLRKLGSTFPIGLILTCIIFGFTFYRNGPHYHAISTDDIGDCETVHDGMFRSGDLVIKRKGNLQIETNTLTREEEHLGVTWLTDCEYQLNSPDEIVKVKIVSVDKNGYDCFVWSNGRTSRRIKVLRQTNAY